MGFAVSETTSMTIIYQKADLEYRITQLTNELTQLSRKSQDIVNKQQAEAQKWIAHDEDPIAGIEYVNSSAFQLKYQALLARIQAREQAVTVEKQQAETKQKMLASQEDGWSKLTENSIKKGFTHAN